MSSRLEKTTEVDDATQKQRQTILGEDHTNVEKQAVTDQSDARLRRLEQLQNEYGVSHVLAICIRQMVRVTKSIGIEHMGRN